MCCFNAPFSFFPCKPLSLQTSFITSILLFAAVDIAAAVVVFVIVTVFVVVVVDGGGGSIDCSQSLTIVRGLIPARACEKVTGDFGGLLKLPPY